MGSKRGDGWSEILGEDLANSGEAEVFPAPARSRFTVNPLPDPPSTGDASVDSVLAALAEEQGLQESEEPATHVGPLPPDLSADLMQEVVPPSFGPAPSEKEDGSLDLPLPPPASGPTEPTAAPVMAASGFDAGKLVEELDSAGQPKASPPGPAAGAVWSEYKEVVVSAGVGLTVLGAVLLYTRGASQPDEDLPVGAAAPTGKDPVPPPSEQSPASARARPEGAESGPAPSGPRSRTGRPPPRGQSEAPAPKKTATPMLSVVTVPSGALVEVDGVIYGRSPLIMPSPVDRTRFSISLKLDDHQTWSREVRPNEAGHFNVNVKLEPFRSR